MKFTTFTLLSSLFQAWAQVQAPAPAGLGAPISSVDRIYTGDQLSNTITVIDSSTETVLGTISLVSERLSDNLNLQYVHSINSHDLGFPRDGKYIVSLSVTSNTGTVVRTSDNSIVSRVYVDRNPHEAFFAVDNRTLWVGTRGVDSIALVDGLNGTNIEKIPSYGGLGKVLFSPDGMTAYGNHIRVPSLGIIDVESRKHIANTTGLAHTFSSDMILLADGKMLCNSHVSRCIISILDMGAETNHPNFRWVESNNLRVRHYGINESTRVYTQPDPEKPPTYVRSILSTDVQPRGLWSNTDNSRLYVVNEHSDTVDVIDLQNGFRVTKTTRVGQEGQTRIYVAGVGLEGSTDHALLSYNNAAQNKTSSALVTIRSVMGLDMFQVIRGNLKLNTIYDRS
ncbi:YVTN repeat-like/Quino protein amine dehydrogenase [Zopfia rhizophila CBS 207.26]|uniref:YVTN repeat-like/Quino protein amine dehydrogenase n=1 Tax=Zopfia rhizophila CBS 207.26 TaxID=1314779 RepID=A0A6A6EP17_9PEZI|nr:YVTN repeat-like/Quino protein amine dehydrogenase [Zopfia rhizophila CBS 207.26]